MPTKKVLLVTNRLTPYREPLFQALAANEKFKFYFYFSEKVARVDSTSKLTILRRLSLFRLLRSNDLDIVVSGGFGGHTLLFVMLRIVTRRPLVIWSAETCASERKLGRFRFLRRWVRRPIFWFADGWLAYGPPACEYLLSEGVASDRIQIVGNPSGVEWDVPDDKDRGQKEVLSVIRMVPLKNPHLHVELARMAIEKFPDIRFTVIGDGPMLPEFLNRISGYGLTNIRHVREVDRQELKSFYQKASVLLHVPDYDRWPHVINEAMICGLPIICTNSCGIPEWLVEDNVNGFVINELNHNSLLEKIAFIARDTGVNKSFGERSRLKAMDVSVPVTVKHIILKLERILHVT